jgi:hypothetical protein
MVQIKKMQVYDVEVGTKGRNGIAYISLTDIARVKNPKEPKDVVKNWLRNKDTILFLGLWEQLNNANFKGVEFDAFKNAAGTNAFTLSAQQWVEKTNAVGIVSTSGNSGGTFAHEDIAFEFAGWISSEFKLYLIQEYKRLKKSELDQLAWDAKRELARINYHIHTDAIKDNLILPILTSQQKAFVYADEADLLNVALFGRTAKEWRDSHKKEAGNGENIRDYATLHQLLVLANLESHNASFIEEKLPQADRIERLRGIAERELQVLAKHSVNSPLLKSSEKKEE